MSRQHINLPRTLSLSLLLLGLAAAGQAEPAPTSPPDHGGVVQMKPFRITATFDIHGRYKKGTKDIDYVKVTWAAPGLLKAGLQTGDLLVSIDGRPMSGMPGAELTRLMDITLQPGEKRTFIFNGKRGLFGKKEWTTTAEFTAGDPSKTPPPPAPALPNPGSSVPTLGETKP